MSSGHPGSSHSCQLIPSCGMLKVHAPNAITYCKLNMRQSGGVEGCAADKMTGTTALDSV